MKVNNKTFKLVFSALMVAVSVILSLFPFKFMYGGSITIFSMVPLVLVSQMYGTPWGMLTCTVYGLIQMMMGLENFGWVSGIPAYIVVFLFDYVLAFALVGLSGVTRKMKNRAVAAGLGAFIGCMLRFFCHIVSGVAVWGGYAQDWKEKYGVVIPFIQSRWLESDMLPYTYSVAYNGLYMFPETILTIFGSAILCTIVFETMKLDVNGASSKKLKTVADANLSAETVEAAETETEAKVEEAAVEAETEAKGE